MKVFHIFIPLLLTFIEVSGFASTSCEKEGSSRSPSLKIKNKILCNYDKEYRPIKDQKQAINISIRLVPKTIDVFSESDGTMEIQNWLGVVWKDDFLTWNPVDYDSVKYVHLTSSEIWTPDLRTFSQKEKKESIFDSTPCLISYIGVITCVLENEHTAHCTTNVQSWPYDTRSCDLVYSTGVYNFTQVTVSKTRLELGALQPNSEWELTNSTSAITVTRTSGKDFQLFKFNFKLKRHSARTTSIIAVPAISLIIMTLVPLWMQPGNTERFCLIAANILSHFLFIQHIGWVAPTQGNKLPPAVTFFRDSLGLAITVLIELTLVKSLLAGRTASPTWLLSPCKLVASGVVGKTVLAEDVQEVKDEENSIQSDNKEMKSKKIQGERCLIVAVLDRILFFVLCIVYFVLIILLIPFN